jgi:hypothetical protein
MPRTKRPATPTMRWTRKNGRLKGNWIPRRIRWP